MDFDAPEDVAGEGGNFLSEPGIYHVIITEIKDGKGPKDNPIDGFTFEMDILGGNVEGCSGKKHRECLFAPDMSKNESSQLSSRRKLAAFFIATNVMTPDQLGKPTKIDVPSANGMQLVIEFERQMDLDESTGKWDKPTKFLRIAYSNIYHVDDPDVKGIPKNEDALGMIDENFRHDAKWFDFKKKDGGGGASKPEPASTPDPTPAEAVSVDDLF